jgi:hypothetical protein
MDIRVYELQQRRLDARPGSAVLAEVPNPEPPPHPQPTDPPPTAVFGDQRSEE